MLSLPQDDALQAPPSAVHELWKPHQRFHSSVTWWEVWEMFSPEKQVEYLERSLW